jgi:ethanolamine-phosphate cytidylyltransferase
MMALPYGTPNVVAHGPTNFMPLDFDPYAAAKDMGIFKEIGNHEFQHVNAQEIVQRIMKSRTLYEERQRKKGEKAVGEEAVLRREQLEKEAEALRLQRQGDKM